MGLENIKSYMIGIILMIVVVTSGVLVLTSFTSVDTTIDTTNQAQLFNKSMNKANEINSSVSNIKSSLNSVTANKVGALGWLNALIGSVFDGAKTLLNTLGFMDDVTTDSSSMLNIPVTITALIILIFVIIVVFALWEAIMRV